MMSRKQKIKILQLILLILTVVIFAYVNGLEEAGKGAYCSGEIVQLSDGWILSNGKEICVPVQLKDYRPQSVEITRILDHVSESDSLVVYSMHTVLKVYIGEEQIYEFGEKPVFFHVPVVNWNVIPMKEAYSGKQLKIVNTAKSDKYRGNIDVIYLGDKMTIFTHIIGKHLPALICAALIFSISLVIVVLWLFVGKGTFSNQILYLAAFGFMVALWVIFDLRIPQFVLGKVEFFGMMVFEILMLLPIPFIMFYSSFEWEEGCEVEQITLIPAFNFILCNLLQFAGIADISQTIVLAHLAMIISFSILCFMNFRYRRRRQEERKLNIEMVGFSVLALTVIVDLIRYNFSQGDMGYSYAGLLIYIVCLMMYVSKGIFSNMMMGRKAAIYEELAYHDKMTGLWNRTAYQEHINELLDLGIENTQGYGVFAFDLNNLKKINDRYGHDRGDRFIQDNADYLKKEMEDIGRVYRTGGDEFICIFDPSVAEKARDCADRLESRLLNARDARINFSYGFAICEKEKDQSFEDTIKRADVSMYAYKRRHKAQRME